MLKNKKGFTLVELLAVIVLLGLLIAVAVPSVIGISKRIQRTMFCTKTKTLESSAKMWGQDNIDTVKPSGTTGVLIKVGDDLVEGGYVKNDDLVKEEVLDPRSQTSLNESEIRVYYKNNRVSAEYLYTSDDENTCK